MQFEEIEGRAEMKVLIVVDMQKDFVDGSLGTPEAQAIVPAVVEKAADYEGKVGSLTLCFPLDFHNPLQHSPLRLIFLSNFKIFLVIVCHCVV